MASIGGINDVVVAQTPGIASNAGLTIYRITSMPLDSTEIFLEYDNLSSYAKNNKKIGKYQHGGTAYPGQHITHVKVDSRNPYNGSATMYQIQNQNGDLKQFATTDLHLTAFSTLSNELSTKEQLKYAFENIPGGGSQWASEIKLSNDLILRGPYTLGIIKPTVDSVGRIPTQTTIEKMLELMFTGDTDPTVTLPTLTLTDPSVSKYEVGKSFSEDVIATFTKGSYSFDNDTGITATWSGTNYDGTEITGTTQASLQYKKRCTVNNITIDGVTMTINATYCNGIVPKTQSGKLCPSKQIIGATLTKSKTIQGYYGYFYGTLQEALTDIENQIDSTIIRSLQSTKGGVAASVKPTTFTQYKGDKQLFFACQKDLLNASSTIVLINGLSKQTFTKNFVKNIKDAGGNDIEYRIFYIDNKDSPATGDLTYTVTYNK